MKINKKSEGPKFLLNNNRLDNNSSLRGNTNRTQILGEHEKNFGRRSRKVPFNIILAAFNATVPPSLTKLMNVTKRSYLLAHFNAADLTMLND